MGSQLTPLGNPQGKGQIGVLSDLHQSSPALVKAKSWRQWLADYFTSVLALSAHYSFKPVLGKEYYLYLQNKKWKLSLIEPQAWQTDAFGQYFGTCSLHTDRTWSVAPCDRWQQHSCLQEAIHELHVAFINSIDNEQPLIEQLPFWASDLPYYQRIGANALARSLKKSLHLKYKNNANKLIGKTALNECKQAGSFLIAPTVVRNQKNIVD